MSKGEVLIANQLMQLVMDDTNCEKFNAILRDIAIRRDPILHKAAGEIDSNKAGEIPAPPRFEDDEKNIMLFIERNKNKNVVVYRAMLSEASTVGKNAERLNEDDAIAARKTLKFNDKEPLDAFWLDIDPAYVASNRKNGVMTNRCELNMIDRKMAYGVHVNSTKPIESLLSLFGTNEAERTKNGVSPYCPITDPRILPVSFVAIDSRSFYMILTKVTTGIAVRPIVYLPIIVSVINGKLSVVERIFVQAKEGGMFSLPKVDYVDLSGWEMPSESGAGTATAVTERIKA